MTISGFLESWETVATSADGLVAVGSRLSRLCRLLFPTGPGDLVPAGDSCAMRLV